MLLHKNALHDQIVKMNNLLDAAKVTRQSILQEKTQYCEQLTCENEGTVQSHPCLDLYGF